MKNSNNNQPSGALIVALGKLINTKVAKAAREELAPGHYDIPVLITGVLEVEVREDPLPRSGTARIPYTRVIAMLLQRAGYTQEASKNTLIRLFQQAEAMDKDKAKALEAAVGLDKGMDAFKEIVAKSLAPIPVKGVVKVSSEGLVIQERELTRAEAEALFPAAEAASAQRKEGEA